MFRRVLTFTTAMLLVSSVAYAQEPIGAGKIEVDSALLGGGVLVLPTNGTPQPHGYVFDLAIAANFTRRIGAEGDFAWAMSRHQTTGLTGPAPSVVSTPNLLFYTGNVIFNPIGHQRRIVPYLEAGGGAITVVGSTATFGLDSTHVTANIGGGVRWFIMPHWGVRGDYRYIVIGGVPDSTAADVVAVRHAQRFYGALVVTW